METPADPTIVVELTPVGRAAVAVVLVSGPQSLRTVTEFFLPASGMTFDGIPIGRIAYGRWGGASGEELVACRRSEETIEIHCHGGTAAVRAVIDQLVASGCHQQTWQDWLLLQKRHDLERHSTARCRDAITSAAQIALAKASTARVAAVLLDQFNGALSNACAAVIEAGANGDWKQAIAILDRMLTWRDFGSHLTSPWRVVLAGAPNVGKSSLINALAGYERALVSPQPGTTRDVVATSTAIAGWPVLLADTAGLRATADELESAGVALATASLREADLIVLVNDASRREHRSADAADDTLKMIPAFPKPPRTIQVLNKVDLLEDDDFQPTALGERIATSAVTGQGVAELIDAIATSLVPEVPQAGEGVPFTAGQFAALEAARRAVDQRDASTICRQLQNMLACGDS